MNAALDRDQLLEKLAKTKAPTPAGVPDPPEWMDDQAPPDEEFPESQGTNRDRVDGGNRKPQSHDGAAEAAAAPLLQVEPASAWADRPEPAPRDWIVEGLIPAGRVTSLLGNGGLGKTLVAIQLAVHIATNRSIFGLKVAGGPVLGIFCEDEQDELERRGRAACAGEGIQLDELDRLYVLSRDGSDNLLCTFEREQIQATTFYMALEATIASVKPRVVFLDTAADLFGGDFMSTPQVRQFLKVALGGLCVRHETAIVLLAHPSAAGIASGDGGGFSTAWHNSVRSRLFLRRPKSEDLEATKDRRVLEVRKSNYGPDGTTVALRYQHGYFVPDPEPIEEGAKPERVRAGGLTKLGLAVMGFMLQKAPAGEVVTFKAIFDALQASGEIERVEYEKARKPLHRTLRQLVGEKLLVATEMPRGYRMQRPGSGTGTGTGKEAI